MILFPDYCRSLNYSWLLCLDYILKTVLSFLGGGQNCLCCGKKTYFMPICSDCTVVFGKELSNRCRICGKELISEIGICSSCQNQPVIRSCDGVFPLASYRLWKKDLLFQWKVGGKRCLSPFFAFLASREIKKIESMAGKKLPVIPVPPRPGKIKEKGWDQIEEICHYLESYWGFSIFRILKRLSKTQQKKLDRIQRLETIGNSYVLKSAERIRHIIEKIPDEAVLLDDVLTTGATIENCSSLLKSFGIKKIYVFTLFVVD